MQTSHLAPLMQALRHTRGPLAAATGVMVGALAFFLWPVDVAWWWGLVPLGMGLIAWPFVRVVGVALVMVALAFSLAALKVNHADVPDFQAGAENAHWLVGRVAEIKSNPEKPGRVTLVLRHLQFYGLRGMGEVREAHIGVYRSQIVAVGNDVAMQVMLLPPEGPHYRGDYDRRWWAYMHPEVVYGYARGTVEQTVRAQQVEGWPDRLGDWLDGLRHKVFMASRAYGGGVVAALLVNNEHGIAPGVRDAYRQVGLAHVLAVSGTQLTLVAALVFMLVRSLTAMAWPGAALRFNLKMIAAYVALAVAAAYTLLAGGEVSIVRAFVMTALVMLAIMLGREHSVLRLWCAAIVVLVLADPGVVMRAGFQLSVAAVLGLIVLGLVEGRGRGWQGWLKLTVLASVYAGAVTAPILVADFGQFSVTNVVANLVAVPLAALATYAAFAGLVLMPVGAGAPLFKLAGVFASLMNTWAVWLAGWPWASLYIPAGWWPVALLFALLVLAAALMRRYMWVLGVSVAFPLMVWGMQAQRPPAEVVVWDDGATGWALDMDTQSYVMLWSDDPARALRTARYALRGVLVEAPAYVPAEVDERYMPVTRLEHFAWAEKRGGRWHVEAVACGRIWQRLGAGCWRDG